MTKHLRAIVAIFFCLTSVCSAQEAITTPRRAELFRALLAARAVHPDRLLVHMSETCSLRIDHKSYPVVDLQELVKGATTPRGVNHIIILSPSLKLVQKIEYTTQRPLFCLENRLYVWGDIMIGNVMPEGSVLTFTQHGREVSLSQVEANDMPVPPTGQRKQPPQ
jgi:hypothetical protein